MTEDQIIAELLRKYEEQNTPKEGNKMPESVITIQETQHSNLQKGNVRQTQTKTNKWDFVIILIASQIQGFAAALKRKDAHLSAWLFWAGKTLQAFVTGDTLSDEPDGIDAFDSPLSDAYASFFLILGFQLRSLSQAIASYDADDLGRDDVFAHLLNRISSVLITLGNK